MFHAGHVEFLRAAAALGDYLLVGVHNDAVVNKHRGSNFPIMNTNERTLSVRSPPPRLRARGRSDAQAPVVGCRSSGASTLATS
jgi:cytidyltransferase-like protein